jgi:hypothetical protein
MKPDVKDTIVYLRKRSTFYGQRAKQRQGQLADRDRAIARAYREDAHALETGDDAGTSQ